MLIFVLFCCYQFWLQDQPLSSLSSVESVQDPSVEPAKAAPKDPLIGKKVCTRWSSPNGPFYEADITEYDPAKVILEVYSS